MAWYFLEVFFVLSMVLVFFIGSFSGGVPHKRPLCGGFLLPVLAFRHF